jgi:hypothetical protein
MVSLMCPVMPATHAGFGQLLEPYHRKCEGPTVMKEMQAGNHTATVTINWPVKEHIQHSCSE